jgi:hypothetical protein
MFQEAVRKEDGKAVFLEYAWDMGWCDPCAAQPLSTSELRELGVFWLSDAPVRPGPPVPVPLPGQMPGSIIMPVPQAQDVFVTRLHLRYDNEHFPEDLNFQEIGDRTNFQGRFVLRHPWTGSDSCEAATKYRDGLRARQETEATTLAGLTGWDLKEIRSKAGLSGEAPAGGGSSGGDKWWRRIWN